MDTTRTEFALRTEVGSIFPMLFSTLEEAQAAARSSERRLAVVTRTVTEWEEVTQ